MQDGRIPDQSITASSFHPHIWNLCLPKNARLHAGVSENKAWCSKIGDLLPGKEYIQIDLGTVKTVTKVATQGHPASEQWVTKYSLSYSNDAVSWTQYNGTTVPCVKVTLVFSRL